MKIAVLNFSGNIGKTTIAKYLLQRKMQCEVFSVESINSSQLTGSEVTKITSEQFEELQTALLINDDLIVDIGSSNVENLLKEISTYSGSQDDFDYFVIPTVSKDKQMVDTISTLIHLVDELQIPKEKIRIVYNMVSSLNNIQQDFAKIEVVVSKLGMSNSTAAIYETDYFDKIDTINDSNYPEELKQKVINLDFMADNQDMLSKDLNNLKLQFKDASAEEKPLIKEQMLQIAQLVQLSRLSVGVRENFDSAFNALFPA